MKNDSVEVGVSIMPMRTPSRRMKIDFDVASLGRLFSEQNDGITKIRPRTTVPEAWMQYSEAPAIGCLEVLAVQPLVKPNGLQKPFWWCVAVFPQAGHQAAVKATLRVSIDLEHEHLALLFRRPRGKVKNLFVVVGFFSKVYLGSRSPKVPGAFAYNPKTQQ